jgi:hypothetical protein
MLAGDPPFTGSSVETIRARKLAGQVPDLRVVRPAVSAQLERTTLRCMALAPADRFRNATELVEALRNASDEAVRAAAGPSTRLDRHAGEQSAFGARARRWIERGVVGAVIATLFATVVGYLSTRAFDVKLQMPVAFVPSRTDYTAVGLHALFPVAVLGFAAVLAWILTRQAGRLVATLAGTLTPGLASRVRSAGQTVRPRWHTFWGSARAAAAADAYFAVSILASALVVLSYRDLLTTLFTAETEILSCANRPLHRSFTNAMVVLITALGFGWFAVFGWLDRRKGDVRGVAVARWGSIALIALLVLIQSIPWRVLWDPEIERVLVDDERAYLLMETPTDLVVYKPERGFTEVHAKNGPAAIVRKHINGYVFEERAAFDSNQRKCLSITGAD